MQVCKLIIDTRERNVTRHSHELSAIPHEIKQITTADYVVCHEDMILIAIERKSLEDFAASIKDGRSDNKKKLLSLREKTGCTIVYIVEGDAFPRPNDCYGNIPYKFIESHIFHLMVRDNITVLRTQDTLGTASTLVRLVQSMNTLAPKLDYWERCELWRTPSNNAQNTSDPESNNGTNNNNEPLDIMAELTKKHVRSDHEIARELWSCFPGIATETADEYASRWSIADIVCERIPRADIANFKMASGRKISKKVVNSLTGINNPIEVRLLSCIEGISVATAKELMSERSLKSLLSYGVAGISMCKVGKSKKSIGDERAQRIIRLFNYKFVQSEQKMQSEQKIQQTDLDNPPIIFTMDDLNGLGL